MQKLNESIYNPNSLSDICCISFIIKHTACATKCPTITATCCHHFRVIEVSGRKLKKIVFSEFNLPLFHSWDQSRSADKVFVRPA